jgi:zinc protease
MKRFLIAVLGVLLCTPQAQAAANIQDIDGKAWLIEDHSQPIVTIKISFSGAGAASDPAGKEGLASFVSQMLDEGSGDMDSLAYNRALEDHAIHFSADISEDSFNITLQSLSEFKGDAFTLLTQAITRPRFDTEAVERIRASIESDLKQAEENPGYVASRKWKELAFPGHVYEHPRKGTHESVAAIQREDLQTFAQDRLRCAGKRVAIVGDITPDEVRKWLGSAFPVPDERAVACLPFAAVADITLPDGNGTPVIIEKDVPQTVVRASVPGIKRSDPRYYAVAVLTQILGGDSLNARLGKEIRDKRGLAYYAVAQIEDQEHAAAISAFFATLSAEAKSAMDLFFHVLKEMSDNGVTVSELNDAKNYIIGSFPLEIDNQSALAEYLIYMQRYGLGKDYLEKRNALIKAVTLEQVNAMAKTLLSHTPLVVMVGQLPAKGKP